MRELKPLVLPKLVEAKRLSATVQPEVDTRERSDSVDTVASFRSEYPSPVSPIFSIRGHGRYSSSTSSLASSPTLHDPSDSFVSMKRPLPDLQEEPHEKEEAVEMVNVEECFSQCFCHQFDCDHQATTLESNYDLDDNPFADDSTPTLKKRREGESPLAGLATRISDRFPSFSRRWKSRRGTRDALALDGASEQPQSQPISSRSSSLTDSITQQLSQSDLGLPPTPSASFVEERVDDGVVAPIDIDKANRRSDVEVERLASTPLLPPLMLELNKENNSLVQSPLQSPTVAEFSRDVLSGSSTPIGTPGTPGMSSPALSTKPSVSSFHQHRPGQFTPSSEIAPIVMADPTDKWADELGHANFHIQPEPYLPEHLDVDAYRQFRSNWEQACCTYLKHLVRTGEHYGVTSKTYKLTEEKWAEIDADWRKKNEFIASRLPDGVAGSMSPVQSAAMPSPVTNFPSLNDPRSEGKFPKLGDEDIVGPMVQIASQLHRRPSKKAVFLRAMQDIRSPANGVIGRVRSASRNFTA